MDVDPCSHKEHDDGAEHTHCWYGKTYLPANGVLDIHNHCLSDQQHHRESGVVPIKEAIDTFFSFICGGVKLVHTKWDATWPYASRAYA